MVTRLRAWTKRRATEGGYTMVEFAIVSVLFLTISFGALDLGRAVYSYSQLHTAVRDAAREAKVSEANGYGFSNGTLVHRVHISKNLISGAEMSRPGLGSATVSYSCTGGCNAGDELTVVADLPYQAVLQDFLGISPITLHASATVVME